MKTLLIQTHLSKKEIFAIIIILGFSIFSTSLLRDNSMQAIIYNFDDAISLSVIKNISYGNGIALDLAGYHPFYDSTRFFSNFPEVPFPFTLKGPIYYLTTSFFLNVFSITPENYFISSSYINTLFFSISLILVFFLIRKYYGVDVAFFSTMIIASISFLNWSAVRLLPLPITMIFLFASLFFLKHKKSNYILFGILSGLAHLTHPQGMMLSFSYMILLLIERKFKGFLIVLTTYFLILSPWMIRNIITVNSPNEGLQLPFLDYFWSLLKFKTQLPTLSSNIPTEPQLYPFELLKSFIVQGTSFYQVSTISVLVLFFLSFFLFYVYLILRKNTTNSGYHIFKSVLNRMTLFSIVFLFVSFLALTYKVTIAPIELRLFLPAMIFLIPPAIFLIFQISKKTFFIQHNFKMFLIPKYYVTIFVILIITIFVSIDFYTGITGLNNYLEKGGLGRESEYTAFLSSWIRNQTDTTSIISTDLPAAVTLSTTRSSVGMPYDLFTPSVFKKYIETYSPQYFIFMTGTFFHDTIINIDVDDHVLQKVLIDSDDQSINLLTEFKIYSLVNLKDTFEHKNNLIKSKNPNIPNDQFIQLLLYESSLDEKQNIQIQKLNEIAESYSDNNDNYNAHIVYDFLIESDRLNFDPYFQKFELYLKDENYDDATNELFELSRQLLFVNSMSERLNQRDLTKDVIQRSIPLYLEIADVSDIEGHRSLEFRIFGNLLEFDRFDPYILYKYGIASEKLELWSIALQSYDLALRLGYDNPQQIETRVSVIKEKLKP